MKVFPTRSEELLSRMVRIIFYYLKSIGLAPISLQRKVLDGNSCIWVFQFSKKGLFYNIVVSILIQTLVAIIIQSFTSASYSSKPSSVQSMDLVVEVLLLSTGWFSVLHSAFRQKQAVFIMNRLVDVHCLLSGLEKKLSNRRPFVYLVIHMILNIFLWITAFVSTMNMTGSCMEALLMVSTTFDIYCFFFEYSIILAVLGREIETLNQNLLNLREYPMYLFCNVSPNNCRILNLSTQSQLAVLELLQRVCMALFEVSQNIADFFSLPILFAVGIFSLALITDVYFLLLPVFISTTDTSFNGYTYALVWILVSIYPLILLSYYVTETTMKARQTGRVVNKLLATEKNKEMIEKLEQFSGQLIHEDVSFTAYGFFSLDFTLLQSIFGATVTYLIIIIQFLHSPGA